MVKKVSFLGKIRKAAKGVTHAATKVTTGTARLALKPASTTFKLAGKLAPGAVGRTFQRASRITNLRSPVLRSKPAPSLWGRMGAALHPGNAVVSSRSTTWDGGVPLAAAAGVGAAAGGIVSSIFGPAVAASLNPAMPTAVSTSASPYSSGSAAYDDGGDDSDYGAQDDSADDAAASSSPYDVDTGDSHDDDEPADTSDLEAYHNDGDDSDDGGSLYGALADDSDNATVGYDSFGDLGDWKSDLKAGAADIGKAAAISTVNVASKGVLNKLGGKPTKQYAYVEPPMSTGKKIAIGAALGVPALFLLTRRH